MKTINGTAFSLLQDSRGFLYSTVFCTHPVEKHLVYRRLLLIWHGINDR